MVVHPWLSEGAGVRKGVEQAAWSSLLAALFPPAPSPPRVQDHFLCEVLHFASKACLQLGGTQEAKQIGLGSSGCGWARGWSFGATAVK